MGRDFQRILFGKEAPVEENAAVKEGFYVPVRQIGSMIDEQLTQADAESNVLTFTEDIFALDIFHNEATWQQFIVNGITLTVPSGGHTALVAGTAGKTVTIPEGVNCIVSRLV